MRPKAKRLAGRLVALLGLPGAGKDTALKSVRACLKRHGIETAVVELNKPDPTDYMRKLRSQAERHGEDELLRLLPLWSLRVQQHKNAGRLLLSNDIVFMNGSFDTARAYALASRISVDWMEPKLFVGPDLSIFIDVPLKVARSRKASKTLENEAAAKKLAGAYRRLSKRLAWKRIDGTQSPEKVAEEVVRLVLGLRQSARRPHRARGSTARTSRKPSPASLCAVCTR